MWALRTRDDGRRKQIGELEQVEQVGLMRVVREESSVSLVSHLSNRLGWCCRLERWVVGTCSMFVWKRDVNVPEETCARIWESVV